MSSYVKKGQKRDNFAIIPNALLNDKNITWQAKGLLSYLLSKPDGWQVRVTDLRKHSKNGRDANYSIINELIDNKYIIRTKLVNPKTHLIEGYEYLYYDEPQPLPGKPYTDSPDTDIPDTVKPDTESQGNSNTDLSNTDFTNTYCSKKENKDSSPISIAQWHACMEIILSEIGAVSFKAWFSEIDIAADGNVFTVICPNQLTCDIMENKFIVAIRTALFDVTGQYYDVELKVKK